MTAIPRIRQLPGAESARVRSAALVPSIAGAVVELLRNSAWRFNKRDR